MKKILVASYFYEFMDSNSSAISINTRVKAIENCFDIDVVCIKNPKKSCLDLNVNLIELDLIEGNINKLSNSNVKEQFVNEIIELLKVNEYAAILIHSNFPQTNFLPKKIKQSNINVKVVTYMPDPFINTIFEGLLPDEDYENKLSSENSVYLESDAIVVTNEFFKQHIVSSYENIDENKITPIFHMYEKEREASDSNYIYLLGEFYYGRKVDQLLLAFDELLQENENLRDIKLVFSNSMQDYFLHVVNKMKFFSNIILIDRVPFEKARELEAQSNIFINIALPINSSGNDPYFPTKLCQYFAYHKPILSIVSEYGLSASLMDFTGNLYCKNDKYEIKKCLHKLLIDSHKPDYSSYSEFCVENLRDEMINIFNCK